jgi:hypothetical protein
VRHFRETPSCNLLPVQRRISIGQTELHASLKGPLKNPSRSTFVGDATTYGNNIQFAAVRRQYSWTQERSTEASATAIRGPYTDLQLQGDFPVAAAGSVAMLAVAQSTQVVQMFIRILEVPAAPNVNGYGQRSIQPCRTNHCRHANVAGDGLPWVAERKRRPDGKKRQIEINQFHGNVSNGTRRQGSISYRPSVRFNVAITANDIRTLFLQAREGVDRF